MSKKQRINYNHFYKIYCPNNEQRFVCYYCGLAAPDLDHVPPISILLEMDNVLKNYITAGIEFKKFLIKRICYGFKSKEEARQKLNTNYF